MESLSNEKRKRSLKQKLNNEWNVYYKKLRKEQKKKRKKWRNGSEKEPEEPAIKRKKDEGTQLSEAAMNKTKEGELAQWPKTATNETKKDELAQRPGQQPRKWRRMPFKIKSCYWHAKLNS